MQIKKKSQGTDLEKLLLDNLIDLHMVVNFRSLYNFS